MRLGLVATKSVSSRSIFKPDPCILARVLKLTSSERSTRHWQSSTSIECSTEHEVRERNTHIYRQYCFVLLGLISAEQSNEVGTGSNKECKLSKHI